MLKSVVIKLKKCNFYYILVDCVVMLILVGCSYNISQSTKSYFSWKSDQRKYVYEFVLQNPDFFVGLGFSKTDDIKNFKDVLKYPEISRLLDFSDTDTLLMIAKFQARKNLPENIKLYVNTLTSSYSVYRNEKNNVYISDEFKQLIEQKTKINLLPKHITYKEISRKIINNETHIAVLALINKLDFFAFDFYGKYIPNSITQRDRLFIDYTKKNFEKILHENMQIND